MRISFIGDVMLGRCVADQYKKTGYQILDKQVIKELSSSDIVIGNLESPVIENAVSDGDHLSFEGNPDLLDQFHFVDCFSLANNHINDCGVQGMNESIRLLDQKKIPWNGLYKEKYKPFIFESSDVKCALFTCTDMMNHPFSEDAPWKVLKIDDPYLDRSIAVHKEQGFFTVLYAHVGMLFTRFPNPVIRALLHEKIEAGADLIVTVHSHALGGMEYYKGRPIFHSIGDFVMDGNSYRRRRSAILNVHVDGDYKIDWEMIPTQIDVDFKTVFPEPCVKAKMEKSWDFVSRKLEENQGNYQKYFSRQYKKEMLIHTLSTLKFIRDTKGINKLLFLIFKRFEEVKRMKDWMTKDRSDKRMDGDAIAPGRKRFNQKDLFDID